MYLQKLEKRRNINMKKGKNKKETKMNAWDEPDIKPLVFKGIKNKEILQSKKIYKNKKIVKADSHIKTNQKTKKKTQNPKIDDKRKLTLNFEKNKNKIQKKQNINTKNTFHCLNGYSKNFDNPMKNFICKKNQGDLNLFPLNQFLEKKKNFQRQNTKKIKKEKLVKNPKNQVKNNQFSKIFTKNQTDFVEKTKKYNLKKIDKKKKSNKNRKEQLKKESNSSLIKNQISNNQEINFNNINFNQYQNQTFFPYVDFNNKYSFSQRSSFKFRNNFRGKNYLFFIKNNIISLPNLK